MAAPNISKAVKPTTTRLSIELGWLFMIVRSQATRRMPRTRNGASRPLMTGATKRAPIGLTWAKSRTIRDGADGHARSRIPVHP